MHSWEAGTASIWPLIVTGSQNLRPIQLGLSVFLNTDTNEPQLLMAASAFTILPIVVLFFVMQRAFVEGIASTGCAVDAQHRCDVFRCETSPWP